MKKYNFAVLQKPNLTTIDADVNLQGLVKEQNVLIHFLKDAGIKTHVVSSLETTSHDLAIRKHLIATRKFVVFANFADAALNHHNLVLAAHLSRFYPLERMHFIPLGALVSGLDFVEMHDQYYIKVSQHTNLAGVEALQKIFAHHQLPLTILNEQQESALHLAKQLIYLENNMLLYNSDCPDVWLTKYFDDFQTILVPKNQKHAMGSFWVNDRIIVPNDCLEFKSELSAIAIKKQTQVLSIAIEAISANNLHLKDLLVLF